MSFRLARLARQTVPVALAVLVAAGLLAAPPAVAEVAAAGPDLTIVGDATYVVQPEHTRIRVTVDLTATNHLHDTATRRYYFDHAFLQVLPGTTGFKLSADSGSPSARVSKKARDYTLLALNFGKRIYSGKSAAFQLRFDLPDPGGVPTRDIHVGGSLVSFPIWAFASPSTPGSTVSVIFPKGYTVNVASGELPPPTSDSSGRTIFRTAGLADPLHFFAYLVGDRPGAYKVSGLSLKVGGATAAITIRAWADDAAWAKRVGRLFGKGLPVLGQLIGLPWTRQAPLDVQEAVSRTTGGYAGLFDPGAGRIEVAYYADAFVVLHESSHAWFNGALLADRWANEAFASYYALSAAGKLKEKVSVDKVTPELEKARIPLNAWGAIGREDPATEDYAYAASLQLAQAIGQRAGAAGLRAVWAAAASRVGAYQPPATADAAVTAETVDAVPDWRGLLDLLEDTTGKSFGDLWRTWVVRPTELSLLDQRASARSEYKSILSAAGPWDLPPVIRQALRAWQFDDATKLMADARAVLGRRAALEQAAADAGLTLPPQLERAFEGGGDFAAANAEADAETAAIQTLAVAAAARPPAGNSLVEIGLIGATPDGDLAAARNAFAAGDLQMVARDAADAQSAWLGAEEVGRNRVLAAIGVALLGLMALSLLITRLTSGRRARRRAMAHRMAAVAGPRAEARSADSRGRD